MPDLGQSLHVIRRKRAFVDCVFRAVASKMPGGRQLKIYVGSTGRGLVPQRAPTFSWYLRE
eukprot:5721664-Pyramimonas_sp.AAC.1